MIKQRQRRSVWRKAMDSAVTLSDDTAIGYLAGYGNRDDIGDRLHKGCCAKSIQERGPASETARKIAMLYMHDQARPVGLFTKLEEKDFGLYYEAKLSMVPFVTSTLIPQLNAKIINQHSIGYNYNYESIKSTEEPDGSYTFDIYEIDLFEGSMVTLGMNENTPFGGFKKFLDNTDDVKQLELLTQKALKGIKNYNKELELRDCLMKYQSLIQEAAEIITAYKNKPAPTQWDLKYLATELSKTKTL